MEKAQWFYERQAAPKEAMLFTGDNATDLQRWAHRGLSDRSRSIIRVVDYARHSLIIRGKKDLSVAVPGDWVVKGEFGFYAIDPEVFAEKFQASK